MKTADNINTAVDLLEHKIRTAIDKCLPRRSTRMSSHDPPWMTPLLRTMLRVKSRISPNNVERLKLINCRIAEVICQNRRSSTAVMGCQEWWKNVDLTSQHHNQSNHLTLGRDSLDCLNDYFGQLCYDENTRPTDVRIAEVGEVPEISQRLVRGVTLQSNCKFHSHVRQKLVKANRCLHVLRMLRKEQCTQADIDHLFISLVGPHVLDSVTTTFTQAKLKSNFCRRV